MPRFVSTALRVGTCLLLSLLAVPGISQQWAVTYEYNGVTSFILVHDGQSDSRDIDWPDDLGYGPMYFFPGDGAQVYASGTITAVIRWLDDFGNPAPNPPTEVVLKQSAQASWMGGVLDETEGLRYSAYGSASNGLESPHVTWSNFMSNGGDSIGTRLVLVDGSTGTIRLPCTMSAQVIADYADYATYMAEANAMCTYQVSMGPTGDFYDFGPYPNPPPAGTTPHAQNTATKVKGPLFDGSAYYTDNRAFTNQTAAHAAERLKKTAIFFVFGHGGDTYNGQFRQFQTFWDGSHWSFIVQTAAARDSIRNNFAANNAWYVPDVQVLDEIPSGALSKVLLAVYEGCRTAYWNGTWGSPVRGTVQKGARCAVGFTDTIYPDAVSPNGQGAESWSTWFWNSLCKDGRTVKWTRDNLAQFFQQGSGLRSMVIEGRDATPGDFKIGPARFGDEAG